MKDTYGREITYLRLSVTERCNLRCRYCMPEEGICKLRHEDMLTEDEMIQAVEVASELGVRKLRITGGEPLVKRNILSICRRASQVQGIRTVAMTTNGLLLPDYAKSLAEAGVSRINISLDTLNPEKYAYMTRKGTLDDAIRGIEAALEADFVKVKINAVLIGGFNDTEIPQLADLTRRYPVDVRFIELMPMTEGEFGPAAYIPYTRVLEELPELEVMECNDGVAQNYRLPGALGNIGVISPVNAHFCARCNRMRLTSDGKLKPCLHRPAEYSLKGLDKDGMRETMKRAILEKPEWHGVLSDSNPSGAGRQMNQIGG